jgi:hypothetical protein
MTENDVFSRIFLEPQKLSWKEISRSGPAEAYGAKSLDELPADIRAEIPENIGEGFAYELMAGELKSYYGRYLQATSPFMSSQYALSFHFGENKGKCDNSLADCEGFEFLGEKKLRFTFGRFGDHDEGERHIQVEHQNMGIARDVGFGPREFSDDGKAIMESLLGQRGNIILVPGLKEEDTNTLAGLLTDLDSFFREGKLEPNSWFYT